MREVTPRRRLGKGEITVALSLAVAAAGLIVHCAADPWVWSGLVLTVGASAFIGSFTNRVAIKALFDYWPEFPPLRLLFPRGFPFTGILRKKKDELVKGLSVELRDLLSPEAFRGQLELLLSSGSVAAALRKAAGEQGTSKLVESWIDSAWFQALRNRLADLLESTAAETGARTVRALAGDPAFLEKASKALADHLEATAADPEAAAAFAEAVSREGLAAAGSDRILEAVSRAVEGALPASSALGAVLDPSFAAHEIAEALKKALASDGPGRATLAAGVLRAAADRLRNLELDEKTRASAGELASRAFGLGAAEAAARLREWPAPLRRRSLLLARLALRRAPAASRSLLSLLESVKLGDGDLLRSIVTALSKKSSEVAEQKLKSLSIDEINKRLKGISGEYLSWLEVYGGVMGALGGLALFFLDKFGPWCGRWALNAAGLL